MPVSRRDFLRFTGIATAGLATANTIRWSGVRPAYAAEQSQTMHVLNRLTWGPRPEDVQKVNELGIAKYIDWQLQPESIPDPLIDTYLKREPALSMGYDQLYQLAKKDEANVINPLIWGRLYRAANSTRQLYELMVEFWTDHFNISIGDLPVEKVVNDREVIRKYALGKFRDLLLASTKSPAMLAYLNQADSTKEHPNENYAREVMELHTLGVSGGYTEKDVKQVARAFTGWTLRDGTPNLFFFDPQMHDTDEKILLGHKLAAGRGIEDGLQVLDILATHPSTAHFISYKLCRRFVSDKPPQSLVDSTAQIFITTEGDIRQVMRHILNSSEFMQASGQKFRRPVDFMVALMRVTRANIDNQDYVFGALEEMGHLPFYWHPPNGYPDAAGAWMNTSGLLNRWNVALSVMDGGFASDNGIRLNIDKLTPAAKTVGELVDNAIRLVLVEGTLTPEDRQQLIAYISNGGQAADQVTADMKAIQRPGLIGLLMASPYFQWH